MRAVALDSLRETGVAALGREEHDTQRAQEHRADQHGRGADGPLQALVRFPDPVTVRACLGEAVAEELSDAVRRLGLGRRAV